MVYVCEKGLMKNEKVLEEKTFQFTSFNTRLVYGPNTCQWLPEGHLQEKPFVLLRLSFDKIHVRCS